MHFSALVIDVQLFHFKLRYDLQLVVLGLTLPFAGWLADVYFGRFLLMIRGQRKLILAGIFFMTAEIVALMLTEIVARSNYIQNNDGNTT